MKRYVKIAAAVILGLFLLAELIFYANFRATPLSIVFRPYYNAQYWALEHKSWRFSRKIINGPSSSRTVRPTDLFDFDVAAVCYLPPYSQFRDLQWADTDEGAPYLYGDDGSWHIVVYATDGNTSIHRLRMHEVELLNPSRQNAKCFDQSVSLRIIFNSREHISVSMPR